MPSLATTAVVHDSADGFYVTLNVRFVLIAGAPSETVYTLKERLPENVDVVLQSDLVITLSGLFNRVKIGNRAMKGSAMAHHFVKYFHVNGEQLGLRVTSEVFHDEEDDITKIMMSSTRPCLERKPPFVQLCAIELLYTFTTSQATPQSYPFCHGVQDIAVAADPFAPHAFLPLVTALDRVMESFVVVHLVRGFPLIFGPWRERFDAEIATSTKIAHAITEIIARSPQGSFRKRCRRILKVLHHSSVLATATSISTLRASISDATRGETDDVLDDMESGSAPLDHCAIICQAMDRVFKNGLKPMRYKGAVSAANGQGVAKVRAVEDNFQLSECRTEHPHHSLEGLDARGWVELWFDEATETVDESQDLFFDDLAVEKNVWVSDGAESISSPLVDDFDDLWRSSQSTLDDQTCELERFAQTSSADSLLRDRSPPYVHPEVLFAYEEDDELVDDSAPTPDQLDIIPERSPLPVSLTSCSRQSLRPFPGHMFPFNSPVAFGGLTAIVDTHAQVSSRHFNEALEPAVSAISYSPIPMDDDPVLDDSGSFYTGTPSPSLPFAYLGQGTELELQRGVLTATDM